ncbi:DUF2207 domain-containing protein [Gracilibacillus phocaeensis]|uniref:DUF2207 domain-containing protein n=1 Tax=Gracilibacillus phocaeensis TaxID=2042304 RepID=UPI00102F32D3|nr:DUF2207 domain-containing protein [Gracilibacillus phocaeensis]
MKKGTMILGFLLVIFLTACSEEDTFTIDKVDMDAYITDEGTMEVRELYTYTFDGSFEGMTRTIESDDHHFQAYLANGETIDADTNNLQPLEVEEDDDTWKVHTPSQNETKQVLYTYEVDGSVTKYQDVADLTYAFFDDSNETDFHDISIQLHLPNQSAEDFHYFLKDDADGELTETEDGITYSNDLVKAGGTTQFRLVFPADQLNAMETDQAEMMETSILEEEAQLAQRAENLPEKTALLTPIVVAGLLLLLGVTLVIYRIHPNRYRGSKEMDSLIRVVEETDPLLLSYIHRWYNIDVHSINAALFSLRRRGIVHFTEVPSERKEEDTAYRFTWDNNPNNLSPSDQRLREWLFTEKDKQGEYFLLESLQDDPDMPEKERTQQAKQQYEQFSEWSKQAKQEMEANTERKPVGFYSGLSLIMSLLVAGMFYYQLTIQPMTPTTQLILTIILAVVTVVSLIFHRQKFVFPLLYLFVIFASLVAFTLDTGTIWTIIFYLISGLVLLLVPAYYWGQEIRQLRYAVKQVTDLYQEGRYPISSDQALLEKRIENAIVLGKGEVFEQKYQADVTLAPLLVTMSALPVASAFDSSHFILYSAAASSTAGTTGSSPGGGGGAGAF